MCDRLIRQLEPLAVHVSILSGSMGQLCVFHAYKLQPHVNVLDGILIVGVCLFPLLLYGVFLKFRYNLHNKMCRSLALMRFGSCTPKSEHLQYLR